MLANCARANGARLSRDAIVNFDGTYCYEKTYEANRHCRNCTRGFGVLAYVGASIGKQSRQNLDSAKLSGLIQEEMKVIARALNEIVQAVVIGEHLIVAEQSRIIHQSFVLEHSGNSEETDKLIASLPQAFVALDRKLHRSAKKLAEAARGQKIDTERYYLSEMIENCVQCHKLFATHRFPSLGK